MTQFGKVVAIGVLACLSGTAVACTNSVTPVRGPDGDRDYLIECSGGQEDCLDMANSMCPHGYEIVTHGSHASGWSPAVSTSELLVKCNGYAAPENSLPPPSAPVRNASTFPPTGAAGFTFGQSLEDASAACTGAGAEWAAKNDRASCSSAPTAIGIPAACRLTFSGPKLREIEIFGTPQSSDGAEWRAIYERLRAKLEEKYGTPSKVKYNSSLECSRDSLKCLADGHATYSVMWRWQSGEQLSLVMGQYKDRAAIQLDYASPLAPAAAAPAQNGL